MNEKIKKLYDQAVSMASTELKEYNRSWKPSIRFEFDYEKVLYNMFAELIIRECSNVAMDNLDSPASAIENHFGVE